MLLWENIVLAINSLLSNKMRALLTMLGIIIGIGAVIAIITVGDSLTLYVSSEMQTMGANDVYVMVSAKSDEDEYSSLYDGAVYKKTNNTSTEIDPDEYITPEMIQDVADKFSNEIYAININQQIGTGTATIDGSSNSANINIYGSSLGAFVTLDLDLVGGRLFSEEDLNNNKSVVVVSDKLVNKLFDGDVKKAIGSEIEASDGSNVAKFTIIGVYEYSADTAMEAVMENDDTATSIYMPIKVAQQYAKLDDTYQYFQIITSVNVDSENLSSQVANYLNNTYYRTNRSVEITTFTLSSMLSMLTSMLSKITLAISIVAGIALIVGGIGVMNIMLVSVTERTREIGTRKALGAKNSSIRIQFIVEAMIICLIGGIIGVILGIVGGIFASNLLGYPAQPSISGIIISLVFSMSIGIFFGYYPANKAAKLNPIDALRYE